MRNLKDIIIEKLKVSNNSSVYWEWEPTTERVDDTEFTRVLKAYIKIHREYDLINLLGEDNLPSYIDNGEVYHVNGVTTNPANHSNNYLVFVYINKPDYYSDRSTYNLEGLRHFLGSSVEYITSRRKHTINNDEKGQAILMKIYNDMKDEVDQ